jgi:hypothetical protein
MPAQTEQLEREAAETRARLAETLDALRFRMTPGQVFDQVTDYASHGPPAELLRNLGREVRENPLPLVLIGIGIVWLMVASSRSSRALIASTADMVTRETADIGAAASAVVNKTSRWSKETATQLVDRVSDITTGAADPPRELPGAVAEKASGTVAPFELSEAVSVEEPEAEAAFGGEDARANGDWRPPTAESMEPSPDGVVQLEAHRQQARRAADV